MNSISTWLSANTIEMVMVFVSTLITYGAILLYTRICGLRSFSKMSAPDFAMTVAVGSLFASTISNPKPSLLIGLFALACLFAGQWFLARLRQKSELAASLIDNQPVLLMKDGEFLEQNLESVNVSRADILAKMREANVYQYRHVLAAIFESTGDISILHSEDPSAQLEPKLLETVRS